MTILRTYKKILLQAFFWGLLFFFLEVGHKYQEILSLSNRIQEDIVLRDGKWDTTAYNADPLLPGTSPIYVMVSDGFVLERWKPITGFLDASDFKHLSAFHEIQTIETITKQDWRIYSLPIEKDDQIHGVIVVSSYHPVSSILSTFDPQMIEAAQYVATHVTVENNRIVIKNFDERKIPHYISFQIVSKSNRIVLKGNNNNSIDRLPNFIDPSYVAEQLDAFPVRMIRDDASGNFFLTYSQPLKDDAGAAKGIIVVGQNLRFLLNSFALYCGLSLTLIALYALYEVLCSSLKAKRNKKTKPTLSFDEKNSQIFIDGAKVQIAYATNQYYLCRAVFTHPQKRWEVDELLEKFGEEPNPDSWRKIYDAMNQVNKKVFVLLGKKLVILDGKTYRFNPELL